MGAVGVVLVVAFVIICVFAILLIMVQNDETGGMGGLLGGRNSAAFGSHSASVLTKTTFVFVVLFFALSISLAVINKSPSMATDLVAPAVDTDTIEQTEENNWWETNTSDLPANEESATDTEATVVNEANEVVEQAVEEPVADVPLAE